MVSIHKVSVDVLLIIRVVYFIFRLKCRTAIPHLKLKVLRKPLCTDTEYSSPRYMRENHYAILVHNFENFSGFQLTRQA